MPGPANVRSVAAIDTVKSALVEFGGRVEHAKTMLDTEIRRVTEWLEHDCPRYWKQQIHEANEDIARAQAELHRCLMFPIADERPSCFEERAALKKAQARLLYCEEKLELVRHWIREINRERFDYDGRMHKLASTAEIDVAQGVRILTKLVRRLEEYQAVRTNSTMSGHEMERMAQELFDEPDEKNSEAHNDEGSADDSADDSAKQA